MPGPNVFGPQPNLDVTPDPTNTYDRYDTYLAVDPNDPDHLVGICRRFSGAGVDYQDQLEAQYSFDGGLTWGSRALPLDPGYYSISDPWIGIAPNGNVYVIALPVKSSSGTTQGSQSAAKNLSGNAVCCYTSTDGGKTFPAPVYILTGGWTDNTFGAVDPNSGMVYAIWNDGAGILGFAYSPDGNSWYPSPSAQQQNTQFDLPIQGFNFVNIAVAPDDASIHIIGWDDNSPANLSYARSVDKGQTFEYGAIATNQIGTNDIQELFQALQPTNPNAPIPAVINPPTIFAAGNGVVFAAWSVDTGQTASNPNPLMRICVAGCSDNGDKWASYQSPHPGASGSTGAPAPSTIPFLPLGSLSQTPQDQYFMPRLGGMPDGMVGCVFVYLQPINNGQVIPAQLSTCLAVSLPSPGDPQYFDSDTTTAVVVSDQSTSPIATNPVFRFGNVNAYFIGDFIGPAANGSSFFAYWSDTRNGSAQIMTCSVSVLACTLILDRSTFGQNEVNATLVGNAATFRDTVYVVVDGFAPSQLSLNTSADLSNPPNLPSFNGSSFLGLSGISLNFDGPVQLEDPTNFTEIQRITFPFDVEFSIPSGSQTIQAFKGISQSQGHQDYTLFATIGTAANGVYPALSATSSTAEIELVLQGDPYMVGGETWWLSNDMRVFTVTPATLSQGQTPLQYSATQYGSGMTPNEYIQELITELNTDFTDPQSVNSPFSAIPLAEDQSALMLSENDANGNAVFNFGLARLHLRGETANTVRVFFRLFISPSPDTDFNQSTTFRSLPQTDASGNNISGSLISLLGIPTSDMSSTIPFFAAPRITSTSASMTTQPDPANVQTIPSTLIRPQPPAGQEVYAYYGCWLDINQSAPQFPISPTTLASTPNGPWAANEIEPIPAVIMGNHACLVAEVSYDPDPIPSGANAATSDKIGQRNLSWASSDNPGPASAHRVPTLFDIRSTAGIVQGLAMPDELMIEWGNTPAGSRASIYWPQANADEVLELAARLSSIKQLEKVDQHTIQCITGVVTYIPIPVGTGPNLAGLLTIDLPQTVRTGQQFSVVVRRLSTRFIKRSLAPGKDSINWRYVVGAFQINIPVGSSSTLLLVEESILAVYKWKIGQIPTANRWHPVLQRYIALVSSRVNGLGGNASSIKGSQTGGVTSALGKHNEVLEHTGKVSGIIFDRFGDFEGFLLVSEEGREITFAAHEHEIEERVREAWVARMVISVFVESREPRRPALIILRRDHRG